ncbi:hypothetical protein JAAARDRAFT_38966 [Jaapia argillacea MUCL 33604]|uniref:Phosphatidylserine decarboxylase n=1 Tax=Jaapia argillacea MUCL 33604 TaxID=933084 RepID=A0A067PTI4_9AGAM|nr:hypothetical protein JAAARDRAFT_38966 [Jaapia argillacea MUCL 33604]
MTSLHGSNITKPLEPTQDPSSLPDAHQDNLAHALHSVVEHTSSEPDASKSIHAHLHKVSSSSWIHKLVPGLEDLASKYHIGNYVVVRGTGEKFFESMPLYARIGMHLLFYGKEQVKVLEHVKYVEDLLRDESVKQGKIYDSPQSVAAIPHFIQTYALQLDELLNPDIKSYHTFNEFFFRKLKADARPIQNPTDPTSFCSPADCRMVVYQTVDLAQKFWIKGDEFTLPTLLHLKPDDERLKKYVGGSLAICRLAPQDYHRFHCPIDAVNEHGEEGVVDVPGQYYTVNPQAVNEPKLDVFTANKRSIIYLKPDSSEAGEVAFIAVGALLVGGIVWTGGKQKGAIKRGDELGYFAYGGSTILVLFPKGSVKFDEDLVKNSEVPVETLMKVGYSVGHFTTEPVKPTAPPVDEPK